LRPLGSPPPALVTRRELARHRCGPEHAQIFQSRGEYLGFGALVFSLSISETDLGFMALPLLVSLSFSNCFFIILYLLYVISNIYYMLIQIFFD
jgi:hypothetical protein